MPWSFQPKSSEKLRKLSQKKTNETTAAETFQSF